MWSKFKHLHHSPDLLRRFCQTFFILKTEQENNFLFSFQSENEHRFNFNRLFSSGLALSLGPDLGGLA